MKKKYFIPVIFISLLASCSEGLEHINESQQFQGVILESSSRTYLDNGNVIWKNSDAISVFLSSGFHHCYELSNGEGTNTATFSYKQSVGTSNKLDCHYAIYPFSDSHILNDDKSISLDLSSWATQNYTENSFEDDQSVMTGKSTTTVFPFYNANSLARVKLSSVVPGSYSISSVSFTSASAALNGKAIINMANEKPFLMFTENNEKACRTNTLVCTSDIILTDEPICFYILMPVGTYNDLTLTINGIDEMNNRTEFTWSKAYNEDITFSRSMIETFNHKFDAVDFSGEIKPD